MGIQIDSPRQDNPPFNPEPGETPRLFNKAWWLFFNQLGTSVTQLLSTVDQLHLIQDTRANRVNYKPAKYLNFSYAETDANSTLAYVSRLVNGVAVWVYQAGQYQRTQAQLSAFASGLGTNDTGLLIEVTDYRHLLKWTGASWQWGPGELGSGWMQLFEVDPNPATGWHLYDGAANVPYLKFDGTLPTLTLPDLVSTTAKAVHLKGGSPDAGPNAATAPGATASGASVGSATTGITNPATTGSSATGVTTQNDSGGGVLPTTGAASSVANHPHTHVMTDPTHNHTIGAPTDPGHTHTLSGLTITVDATGEPRNLVRRPFFRQ